MSNCGVFKTRKKTYPVLVRNCTIGDGNPIVIQSMTNTNTEDVEATVKQIIELYSAGAEIVRITVNSPLSAKKVPEIRARLEDAGYDIPLVGDFHYTGHILLRNYPECAKALDKYRINPGNVGKGAKKSEHFSIICKIAKDLGKPIRIGVNIGSLDEELVKTKMDENARLHEPYSPEEVYDECMVISAIESIEEALKEGLSHNQIVVSCKSSSPLQLIRVHRKLSSLTMQPLHIGLTEAGSGYRGIVWSTTPLAILLSEGIGDTIRISLTPTSSSDRREEVYVAQEILQSLGLRSFSPQVISCPGCGRTANLLFQEIAEKVQDYVRTHIPEWKLKKYRGFENLKIAVMGCIVNGPGEARFANIALSLPGREEQPQCSVFINGVKKISLTGNPEEITTRFIELIEDYIRTHYST
ncbi:MAG: flavodoxin-dependent (E)-4-hydroxy-3-methylbut-2-enyl-diphosphate synthase [Candidatus Hydrogenedentes bacterium]|nr:flavodoxin-dependent (E)-4-hydroxy-3-methylbut-2-enyl-diphosphate synthase [Candidatus Hydrogenedentota bacterium]